MGGSGCRVYGRQAHSIYCMNIIINNTRTSNTYIQNHYFLNQTENILKFSKSAAPLQIILRNIHPLDIPVIPPTRLTA
jgi:hypothetical protein